MEISDHLGIALNPQPNTFMLSLVGGQFSGTNVVEMVLNCYVWTMLGDHLIGSPIHVQTTRVTT